MEKIIGKVSFPLGQEERVSPVESAMTCRGGETATETGKQGDGGQSRHTELEHLEKSEEQIPEPEKKQKTVAHLSVMFAVLITAFAVTCEYFFLRGSGSAMAATILFFLALSVANIQRKPLKVVLYLLCSVVTIGNLYLAVGTQWSELINWSNVFLALIPMSIAIFQKKRRHLVLGTIFTVFFALSLLSTVVQLLNMSYEMIIHIVGVIGFVFLFALWASINLISQKRAVQITGGIITIVLAVVLFVFETNVYQGLFKELNSSSIEKLIMLYATVCFLFLAALFVGSISIIRGIMLKDKISNHR